MSGGLKERLDVAVRRKIGTPHFDIERSKVAAAGIYVQRLLNAVEAELPAQVDISAVAEKMWAHFSGGSDDWSFRPRAVRLSPWALFAPVPGQPAGPLMAQQGFLAWYEAIFRKRARPRPVIALIHSFLFHYDTEKRAWKELREFCVRALTWANSPRLDRLRDLIVSYKFLEPDVVTGFARQFKESGKKAPWFISEAGLSGGLSDSGFLRIAARHVADLIRHGLDRQEIRIDELERLLGFQFLDASSKKSLRGAAQEQASLAEALLMPFVSRDPEPDIQSFIKGFILEYWGDPRLDRSRWWRVSDNAQSVLRRWLVKETLDDFFRLLDRQSQFYEDADRQWRYRSAFWQAYLKGGYITDAWVALGQRVRADARRFLETSSIRYANLNSGNGARPDHAVLILRVGSLVVVEWSHSAKCRVWSAGDENVPQFYRKQYQREELVTGNSFEQIHHAAANGNWQSSLSGYIRQRTGVKMGLRSLMPNE